MKKTQAVILFEKWFKETGKKKQWFAKELGVNGASISRWLSGEVRPHNAVRKRIEQLTDGAVPMDAWNKNNEE